MQVANPPCEVVKYGSELAPRAPRLDSCSAWLLLLGSDEVGRSAELLAADDAEKDGESEAGKDEMLEVVVVEMLLPLLLLMRLQLLLALRELEGQPPQEELLALWSKSVAQRSEVSGDSPSSLEPHGCSSTGFCGSEVEEEDGGQVMVAGAAGRRVVILAQGCCLEGDGRAADDVDDVGAFGMPFLT
ncbi:hypothetical protein PLESTB_001236600 [Pleodorina starrii]|uniref:Uncharacterized protein n=1 Tax=Pleodorina starrii TaxID=330485 RepID=A0A9W6F5R2_9CHLO|nr:hypothetical protein PLESTM_000223100 [Pleodorina starrii]GLC57523.1 hypothetical protein PLESTB_001236600 [Pleodorina starrii]